MSGIETLFIVVAFAAWCALLTKATTDIMKTQQSQSSKVAWAVLVWTIPLLGLLAWAYFRGRPKD